MAQPQKHPLRPLTKQEQQEMQRIVKATSERVDVVRRARALLAVAAGSDLDPSGSSSRIQEQSEREPAGGALQPPWARRAAIAPGRGASDLRQPGAHPHPGRGAADARSSSGCHRHLVARHAGAGLRKSGLPQVGATTIRRVLHEARYSAQRTRTWCPTGTALRKRKAGMVHGPRSAGPGKTTAD